MTDPEDFDEEDFDDGDEIGAAGPGAGPAQTAVEPTWTWGSSASVKADTTSAVGAPPFNVRTVTAQLAQISLPEPAVCSLYFQASATFNHNDDTIQALTLNLYEGVGRVTVPRQITFPGQPAPGAPVEFTLAFTPLHSLQVDITLAVQLQHADSVIELQTFFILTPVTRIPQKEQKLAFGMALPGEADDLDDELRQDLEAEGPTAAQAVAEGRVRVDGSNDHVRDDDEGDDDEGDDAPAPKVHPVVARLIEQLTARHGRLPTKPELRKAVQRFKARQARRQRRGR
jgi:hypothetical protein